MTVIHHKTDFSQTSQLLFMFQCNEHVEMNKFLRSLACSWMTIIDSQLYIIDSLSLDVSFELNAILVVAWLYAFLMNYILYYVFMKSVFI